MINELLCFIKIECYLLLLLLANLLYEAYYKNKSLRKSYFTIEMCKFKICNAKFLTINILMWKVIIT